MLPEVLDEIFTHVRSGFFSKEEIVEILCKGLFPGELDPDEISLALDTEIKKFTAEQATWPAVTDCDRLDIVFAALNERGVVALQNAGYMLDDGYDEVWEAYPSAADDERTVGYCFYHGQDMEGAIRDGGLCLAFGPVEPSDEATKGPAIGRIIKEELEKASFQVEWDGTFKTRIFVPKFDWKRRFSGERWV